MGGANVGLLSTLNQPTASPKSSSHHPGRSTP